MPFPDAKYPPGRKVMDAWRLALLAISMNCYRVCKPGATPTDYQATLAACWDCATTALKKEEK